MSTSTSPVYGLIAPNGDDPIRNGDNVITQLRNQLEALLAPAWITSGFAAQPGWSLTTARGKLLPSGIALLDVVASRTGATITGPANGNVASTGVATIPAAFYPATSYSPFVWSATNTGGTGQLAGYGTAFLTDMHPTSTIVAGDDVRLQFLYARV